MRKTLNHFHSPPSAASWNMSIVNYPLLSWRQVLHFFPFRLHDFNVVITHLLVQYVFILAKSKFISVKLHLNWSILRLIKMIPLLIFSLLDVGSKPICFPELGWSFKNGRPNLQASHCWYASTSFIIIISIVIVVFSKIADMRLV